MGQHVVGEVEGSGDGVGESRGFATCSQLGEGEGGRKVQQKETQSQPLNSKTFPGMSTFNVHSASTHTRYTKHTHTSQGTRESRKCETGPEREREKKKQLEQVWQSPACTHVSDWHLTLLPGGTQGSELWVVGCGLLCLKVWRLAALLSPVFAWFHLK